MSKLKFFIISFVFIAFNVLYASPRRPKKQAPTSPPESTSDSVLPGSEELPPSLHQQEGTPKSLTVFLVLNPEGETQKVVDFLSAHPELPITIIFPPHYFDAPARRPFIGQFSSKQSSHTLEIALALDSEPNLALLNDLSAAGEKVRKWGFNFAWPEDVAAHIARASAKYQKRWGTLPAGLFPPLGTISEPVAKTVTKFRLNWLLGQPSDNWGIRFYGGMAMMVPPNLRSLMN